MAANINIPSELLDPVVLRRFLIDLLTRIITLEEANTALANRVKELETP